MGIQISQSAWLGLIICQSFGNADHVNLRMPIIVVACTLTIRNPPHPTRVPSSPFLFLFELLALLGLKFILWRLLFLTLFAALFGVEPCIESDPHPIWRPSR